MSATSSEAGTIDAPVDLNARIDHEVSPASSTTRCQSPIFSEVPRGNLKILTKEVNGNFVLDEIVYNDPRDAAFIAQPVEPITNVLPSQQFEEYQREIRMKNPRHGFFFFLFLLFLCYFHSF